MRETINWLTDTNIHQTGTQKSMFKKTKEYICIPDTPSVPNYELETISNNFLIIF